MKKFLTEDNLSPCQYCLEEGEGVHNPQLLRDPSRKQDGWQVRCTWCDTETCIWETREEAIETWNDIYSVKATEESKNK
jgi:hypothetical protein